MHHPNRGIVGFGIDSKHRFCPVELSARYSYVGSTEDLRKEAADRAQDIINAATEEDSEAVTAQYENAGNMYTIREINAGINVYIIGRNLKLQNYASWLTLVDYTGKSNEDFRFRSQLQLAF